MSSSSELSGFAARLREFILASEWGANFEALALQLFALQFERNASYRRLCEARGARPDTVAHWTGIPAAPTSAFKELDLSCLPVAERTTVFHSSGTTGQRPSRHFHNAGSLAVYEASLWRWFGEHFQLPMAHCQLAILTPPPAQAPHSSLAHMFETIRRGCGSGGAILHAENDGLLSLPLSSKGGEGNGAATSEHRDACKRQSGSSPFVGAVAADGTWTLDAEAALERLRGGSGTGQPLLMLGTAFSFVHLLDYLAERDLGFELPPGSCALETGGYKGRSRSLPKAALHALISQRLGIPPSRIICEYGMSELSSQAYDLEIGGVAAESSGVGNSSASFPLTPALSLGEREDRRPRVFLSGASGKFAEREGTPPFPEGEGWGEGKQSVRPPSAATLAIASERLFRFPPWARVQVVSPETGSEVAEGETGLIRVFDLANVYSVMAIQTEDLGIRRGEGFALAGRAVLAEPRGCSLLAV